MAKRNGVALMGLFLIVTCLPAMLLAVNRRVKVAKAELPAATVEVVDMFRAMDSGQIGVKFIPKNDKGATLIITNKLKKPLSVRLPEAFAGVPVLAQGFGGMGGGGMGGGGMGGMGGGGMGGGGMGGGGSQGMGGGFGGGMGGGGMGGGGMGGMGGGFFNVQPEQVRKVKVACLCLDHGKTDPTPRMKYEIKPIKSYVQRPDVVELVKAFGRGGLNQPAAQAAVWHLNNDVSWQELAAKRSGKRLANGAKLPYFSVYELRGAVQIASASVGRARALQAQRPADPSRSHATLSDH
jgi:hypothetical protein